MKAKFLEIISKIIKVNTKIEARIVSMFKKNSEKYIMTQICKAVENNKYDVSFRLRPQDPSNEFILPNLSSCDKFSIILQGPIRNENSFTLNTVKYYKSIYSNAVVIVSTWDDTPSQTIEQLESAGAIVVTSKKPDCAGHLNINLQLTSTKAGVNKSEEFNVKYVCKSRTDQRICKKYVFSYLINLINTFPPDDKKQVGRVISLAMHYGDMFYPYMISDFFYFGHIEDIKRLFSLELDTRKPFAMEKGASKREYSVKSYAPEVYFMKKYFESLGHYCGNTVKDYWEAIRKYLICVDRKTLDLFWPKYDRKYEENAYFGDYSLDDNAKRLMTLNFDFVNWLNLYCGTIEYSDELERYADEPFV